jgi:hypothetical protein
LKLSDLAQIVPAEERDMVLFASQCLMATQIKQTHDMSVYLSKMAAQQRDLTTQGNSQLNAIAEGLQVAISAIETMREQVNALEARIKKLEIPPSQPAAQPTSLFKPLAPLQPSGVPLLAPVQAPAPQFTQGYNRAPPTFRERRGGPVGLGATVPGLARYNPGRAPASITAAIKANTAAQQKVGIGAHTATTPWEAIKTAATPSALSLMWETLNLNFQYSFSMLSRPCQKK